MHLIIGKLKAGKFYPLNDDRALKFKKELSDGLYLIWGEIQNGTIKPEFVRELSGLNLGLFKKSQNKLKEVKDSLNV